MSRGKRQAEIFTDLSPATLRQAIGQGAARVSATELMKERDRLNQIMANHTGQPIEVIEKESDRDRYFSSFEAKEFGLVDDVLTKPIITESKR